MSKRAIAAFLWFAATWVGYEIVWSVTGVPRVLGPVVAFAVAAIVTVDPLAAFWPRPEPSVRSRPIEVDRTLV
jgi:hypothetical protein